MRFLAFSFSIFSFLFINTAFAEDFKITTSAFSNLGTIPQLYTCDGSGQSPDLSWSNPPTNTQSFALIVSDPDAPNGIFYHWVMYNIPSATHELIKDLKQPPEGSLLGKNTADTSDYKALCPPKGVIHRYIFTIYALDTKIDLPADSDASSVLNAIKGHVLKQAQIMGTYSRHTK